MPYSVNTTHLIISTNQCGTTAVDHVTPRQQIFSILNLLLSPSEDIDLTSGQTIGYLRDKTTEVQYSLIYINTPPPQSALYLNYTHFYSGYFYIYFFTILN
jgi:hypothetical protein